MYITGKRSNSIFSSFFYAFVFPGKSCFLLFLLVDGHIPLLVKNPVNGRLIPPFAIQKAYLQKTAIQKLGLPAEKSQGRNSRALTGPGIA